MKSHALLRPLAFAVAVAALPFASLAQPAALAPGQVSGAEIKAWFDADEMAVAGMSLGNSCAWIARGTTPRRQTIYCPNTDPFTVMGEASIVGDQLCSKFSYPDGSKLDACQAIVKVGDNKYELRINGVARNVFYRLVR